MMSINIKSEVEHRQQISIKLLICFVWVCVRDSLKLKSIYADNAKF